MKNIANPFNAGKEILDMITEKRIACAALEQELNDLKKPGTQFMSISEYKERIVSLKNQESLVSRFG